MNCDHFEFKVSERYLYALTYGIDDDEGMSDAEVSQFEQWRINAENTATAALIRQFETAGPPSEHCKVRPVLRLQRPGAK